ncbi:MAG TPA: 1-deoxy-D-xylulose-5-phosphate synthase N-terminal domain-containing protein, partial [Clostridia bacterium]|nr:1-deoxy-D-xylulose-5-phosphate synthase N-terminal domain-containing protein [Clostridia bacterium]
MGSLLDKLNLPEDLPKLDIETLDELAEEIRQRLVDVVSKNGGHLASNLGIVELTLGMYTVWNPYKDRIVWDVGHQCYVHKILTGRNKELATLRQLDGISGFPKREENPADAFNTGHSSTSISAALGIMRGLGLQKGKSKCIAVIGDGALTGGMAFEALNDAARVFNDFVIILNDNGMSISRNVGGMSRYLGKIRTGRSYIRIKKGLKNTLYKIPFIGEKLVKLIQKFKLSIKILV